MKNWTPPNPRELLTSMVSSFTIPCFSFVSLHPNCYMLPSALLHTFSFITSIRLIGLMVVVCCAHQNWGYSWMMSLLHSAFGYLNLLLSQFIYTPLCNYFIMLSNVVYTLFGVKLLIDHYWLTTVTEPALISHWGQFHSTSRVYINPSFCRQNHLPEEDPTLHLWAIIGSSIPVIVINRLLQWSCCILGLTFTSLQVRFFTPKCCKVTSWPTSCPTDSGLIPLWGTRNKVGSHPTHLLACREAKV